MFATLCRAVCAVGLLVSLWGCGHGFSPNVHRARPDRALAQQLNDRALGLIEQGRLAEAQGKLQEALDADPFSGPVHNNIALVYLQTGEYYNSAWHFHSACRLMPKAAQPRANLGILYEAVGKYGEGEQHLRQALELAPGDVEIIGHLARLHVRQNQRTPDTLAWLQTVATQDNHPAWQTWAREQLISGETAESQSGR